MGSASAPETTVSNRRRADRQADRITALVEATVVELRALGYEGLTVRNAAKRAGVAAATAYTYFGSKDHLVAEVFWRRLAAVPELPVDGRHSPRTRVAASLRQLALAVAAEPALAAASTTAVLATDPDVARLRVRIGLVFDERIARALGPDADPAVRRTLNLALAGGLLQAGMGYFSYTDLADRLAEVADVVLGGQR